MFRAGFTRTSQPLGDFFVSSSHSKQRSVLSIRSCTSLHHELFPPRTRVLLLFGKHLFLERTGINTGMIQTPLNISTIAPLITGAASNYSGTGLWPFGSPSSKKEVFYMYFECSRTDRTFRRDRRLRLYS